MVILNHLYSVKFNYPISFLIGFTLASSVVGQSLSSSLQLNPKKLTGFFSGAEAPHQEALRLSMKEFAENADGLQLVYVASESNVVKFNELKSADFSAKPPSSRGFFAYESQTQIGKALIQKFKVSAFPSLLTCNADDLVLDANGASSLKARSDPYAHWKALNSASKSTVTRKPVVEKKLGYDAEIEKLEIRRLQILSSINDLLYGFSASINGRTVDDAKALETLRLGGNRWIAYSVTLSEFAVGKVREVEKKIADSSTLSLPIRKVVVAKLDQQRETLIEYRDTKFPNISTKRNSFNKVVDQCNELLQTVDILGREKAVSLIDQILFDFQKLHFSSPKK